MNGLDLHLEGIALRRLEAELAEEAAEREGHVQGKGVRGPEHGRVLPDARDGVRDALEEAENDEEDDGEDHRPRLQEGRYLALAGRDPPRHGPEDGLERNEGDAD